MKTADVVVIGAGVMGSSIAYHLAKRGCHNVVVVEKEALPGAGATGACAGGIRHQFSTAINIELSKLSIQMLKSFTEETGQELDLNFCGYFFLLDNEEDLEKFHSNIKLQNDLGVASRFLEPDQLTDLLPQVNLEGIIGGSVCPDDGLADPGSVVQGYISRAQQMGAHLSSDTSVTGITIESDHVRGVQTSAGPIASPVVVIAAGPWSGQVAGQANLSLPVRPLRRQLAITTPMDSVGKDFPFVIDFSQSLYFHFEGGGILTGMSNTSEKPGFDTSIDEDWRLTHFEAAIHRLPLLADSDIMTEWAGLYEMTPDHQPILGRMPQAEGLVVCTGFSGHGFMHGPVCGLLMAEEILDGKAHTLDIHPLRWERFKNNQKAAEYNVV